MMHHPTSSGYSAIQVSISQNDSNATDLSTMHPVFGSTISTRTPYFNRTETYTALATLITMGVATIFGNSVIIAAFIMKKNLRTTTNYYLVSLCVADILIGALVDTLYAVYIVGDKWPLDKVTCIVWLTADYWVFQASVFGVLIITIDRFLMIKYPFINHTSTRTASRVKIVILCKWFVSFLIWGPLIFYYEKEIGEKVNEKDCALPFNEKMWVKMLTGVFSYVLPVIIMIYVAVHTVYLLIASRRILKESSERIRRQHRRRNAVVTKENQEFSDSSLTTDSQERTEEFKQNIGDLSNKSAIVQRISRVSVTLYVRKRSRQMSDFLTIEYTRQNRRVKEIRRMSTFVLLMAITFAATILPFGIVSIMKAVSKDSVNRGPWRATLFVAYFNSTLNPLCYAYGKKSVNVALKEMFCGNKFRERKSTLLSRNSSGS